jgi:hypothetical protein
MTLEERIAKVRDLIAQRDEIDRQIAECLGDAALSVRPVRAPKAARGTGRRPYTRKPTDSAMAQDAARRHPATEQIEELLIEGLTTAAIMEQVEVSAPTVGVIRARLRKEGRLVE